MLIVSLKLSVKRNYCFLAPCLATTFLIVSNNLSLKNGQAKVHWEFLVIACSGIL